MTALAEYRRHCPACSRAGGEFTRLCLSCVARDCARTPRLEQQRQIAADLKTHRNADEMAQFYALREAWIDHDGQQRRAA